MEENKTNTRRTISNWVSQFEPVFSYYCKPITNIKPARDLGIIDAYTLIKGPTYKETTLELRSKGDSVEKKEFKKYNFDYCTFSGKFSSRKDSELLDHSGYITIDFDNVPDVLELKSKLIEDPYLDPELLFTSPSGDGLKCILKIDLVRNTHQEYFEGISNYILATYDLEVDKSGKDVSRACFLCHDPEVYIKPDYLGIENNKDTKPFNPSFWKNICKPSVQNKIEGPIQPNGTTAQVEEVIEQIEAIGVDLTSAYSDWVKIGFAFADQFGEQGREYFHRVSQMYPNYSREECDRQYTNCLNSNGSGVGIGSFFQMCKNEGITYTIKKEEEPKIVDSHAPLFPKSLYPQLPEILKKITDHGRTDVEKDTFLIGSIAVFSACLPNIYGIIDGDKIFPNLYFYLVGKASAGKGKLNLCKLLVDPIHTELRNQTKLELKKFEEDLKLIRSKGSKGKGIEMPSKPVEKMLFIPANSSASGAYQLLSDNNGSGLIFETEGDTLAFTFKTDYGNYSDGFRKAFHHEKISFYRKTEREYVEIQSPKLSTVLSGTPQQVTALIPSAENGLFSRFIFYYIELDPTFKNVFENASRKGLAEYFEPIGLEYHEFYKKLKEGPEIWFKLTDLQVRDIFEFFKEINSEYFLLLGKDYLATIRRLATSAVRFTMILSALRQMDKDTLDPELTCGEQDFQIALSMVKVLIQHSEKVFNELPIEKQMTPRKNKRDKFLESLPKEFNRKSYLELASKQSIPAKTADGYIKNFCDSEILSKDKHDHYIKN
uniref:DUF3987 domain-containing protein n=1 Tax=Algoriphagus sp. TaxID=1872435 RepID=UPI0040489371